MLTILHNFHLKRPNGTTSAQYLFDYEFPDLFEWIIDHMDDLPLARRPSKSQRADLFYLGLAEKSESFDVQGFQSDQELLKYKENR